MRILRRFTQAELVITAEIREENCKVYVRRLLAAAYLHVIMPRRGTRSGNTYQLVRDTGPAAPIPWHNGETFDPNERTIYGPGGVVVVPTGERRQ